MHIQHSNYAQKPFLICPKGTVLSFKNVAFHERGTKLRKNDVSGETKQLIQ